jgi:hypothetical protein
MDTVKNIVIGIDPGDDAGGQTVTGVVPAEVMPPPVPEKLSRLMSVCGRSANSVTVIDFTNHAGIRALRRIDNAVYRYGTSHYHPKPQWFVKARDVARNVDRDFDEDGLHYFWSDEPNTASRGVFRFPASQVKRDDIVTMYFAWHGLEVQDIQTVVFMWTYVLDQHANLWMHDKSHGDGGEFVRRR